MSHFFTMVMTNFVSFKHWTMCLCFNKMKNINRIKSQPQYQSMFVFFKIKKKKTKRIQKLLLSKSFSVVSQNAIHCARFNFIVLAMMTQNQRSRLSFMSKNVWVKFSDCSQTAIFQCFLFYPLPLKSTLCNYSSHKTLKHVTAEMFNHLLIPWELRTFS